MLSRPAFAALPRARRQRLSRPRGAQQAVRSGHCADLLSVCEPLRLAVWFWLVAGQGAETEGGREVVAAVFSRDHDHAEQGGGGEGADQHRLQIARKFADGSVDELSGSVHTT